MSYVAIWRPVSRDLLRWWERAYGRWSCRVLHYRTDTGERAWI